MPRMHLATQNKIYRAVHDGICPACGNDINYKSANMMTICTVCGFSITQLEMSLFREGVLAWCKDLQARLYIQQLRQHRYSAEALGINPGPASSLAGTVEQGVNTDETGSKS